jgi:hypothetical protein
MTSGGMVFVIREYQPRACPGDSECIENAGFPMKDFGNDGQKTDFFA